MFSGLKFISFLFFLIPCSFGQKYGEKLKF